MTFPVQVTCFTLACRAGDLELVTLLGKGDSSSDSSMFLLCSTGRFDSLDSPLPQFQYGKKTYTGATLLHLLLLKKDGKTIKARMNEITEDCLNKTCTETDDDGQTRQVRSEVQT